MIAEAKAPKTGEGTTPQIPRVGVDKLNDPKLTKPSDVSYAQIRTWAKDPTIALCLELMPGPIIAANWGFDVNDDWVEQNGEVPPEAVALVKEDMTAIRDAMLTVSIKGLIKYGWVPFEKVFEQKDDGYIHLTKVKSLVQEYTDILVEQDTGAFAGFWQDPQTTVPLEKSLLFFSDIEGTNWYGESKFVAAGPIIDSWNAADDGATRYDEKVAGSHWVIRYPIGRTEYNGVEQDNYDIAVDVLNSLEASGKIILPNSITKFVQNMNEEMKGWEVEAISDSVARQYSFTNRLEYLDKLKVRAMGYPERAILEGTFGTKAEAGVHANIAASAQDVRHRYICATINQDSVDQLLVINFGPEFAGAVRVVPAPITDANLTFLQNVYKMMMNSPEAVVAEYNEGVDMPRFKDKVGIPRKNDNVKIELQGSGGGETIESGEETDENNDDDSTVVSGGTQNRFNTNPAG